MFDKAVRVVSSLLPALVNWAVKRLESGENPQAELIALMDLAEAQAEAAEKAKFGA